MSRRILLTAPLLLLATLAAWALASPVGASPDEDYHLVSGWCATGDAAHCEFAQGGSEATHLSQWAGLGKKHPVLAGLFGLLLLAFAGIPLTSGFTSKFAVFAPAIHSGGTMGVVLVVIGVLASAVTAYVYFRIIVLMYFTQAPEDDVVALTPSVATTIVVTVGVLATLLLGIVPGLLLQLAQDASTFLL